MTPKEAARRYIELAEEMATARAQLETAAAAVSRLQGDGKDVEAVLVATVGQSIREKAFKVGRELVLVSWRKEGDVLVRALEPEQE